MGESQKTIYTPQGPWTRSDLLVASAVGGLSFGKEADLAVPGEKMS